MQLISDNDGLAVRGMGTYANVWGQGTAEYRGQTSTNGYEAGASHRRSESAASGSSLSYAGTVKVRYSSGHGLSVRASLGVAGGSSTAAAH
jgi:hypothetical protein